MLSLITTRYMLQRALTVRYLNTKHMLIRAVDWIKIQAGYYAVVDPNDSGSILYLTEVEYKEYWKVASSNRLALIILARPGELQPNESDISAPPLPKFPLLYHYRKARVYSRVVRRLWGSLWESGLVVPLDRNIKIILNVWGNTLRLWTGTRSRSSRIDQDAIAGTKHLLHILKNHGPLGLSLYLKSSYLVVQKYLSGERVNDPMSLAMAVGLSAGLPAWIPGPARYAIRCRSHGVIRVWTSILYSYRGFFAVGKPSFKSIMLPALDTSDSTIAVLLDDFKMFIENHFWPSVDFAHIEIQMGRYCTPPCPTSSGPNGPATLTAHEDSWLLQNTKAGNLILDNIQRIVRATKHQPFVNTFNSVMKGLSDLVDPKAHNWMRSKGLLSRLAFLPEAAGKVRVVAIIDYFSQWALRPLHDFLFDILRTIPQDATFDQTGSILGFAEETAKLGTGYYSSLDISSATDTIPYQLYLYLLEYLLGDLAETHLNLMRDRDFRIPATLVGGIPPEEPGVEEYFGSETQVTPLKPGDKGYDIPRDLWKAIRKMLTKVSKSLKAWPQELRYTRGQPMGAYGSFGLLSLLHHALIRFAALRAGHTSYGTYRVLGDDSVMFEKDAKRPIMNEYLDLCKLLGIPISLKKSFVSEKFFTFASRSFLNGTEISPVSLRAELGVNSTGRRVELAFHLLNKGWGSDSTKKHLWLSRLIRLLSEPMSYFFSMKLVTTQGLLGAILSRLVSVALVPRLTNMERLGFKFPPIKAWLASLRGSARIMTDQVSIPDGTFQDLPVGNEYEYFAQRLCWFLWTRLATEVALSNITALKNLRVTELGFSKSANYIHQLRQLDQKVITDTNVRRTLGAPIVGFSLTEAYILTDQEVSKLLGLHDIRKVISNTVSLQIPVDCWHLTPETVKLFKSSGKLVRGLLEAPLALGYMPGPDGLMTRIHGKAWTTVAELYEDHIFRLFGLLLNFTPVKDYTVREAYARSTLSQDRVFRDSTGKLDLIGSVVLGLQASMLAIAPDDPENPLLAAKRENKSPRVPAT